MLKEYDKESLPLNVSNRDHPGYAGNNAPILETDVYIKTYKRRWYILFIYSMLPFLQSYLFNVWPTIAVSIGPLFGWSLSEISLMQISFYIMFFVSIFPTSWLIQKRGMRLPVVVSSTCLLGGAFLRCISMSPPTVTWLNIIGNCLIGITIPVCWVAGPVISALWFPPGERVFSTSIAAAVGLLGNALCFLIGPLYIGVPEKSHRKYSTHLEYNNLEKIENEIRTLRIVECVACGLLFITTLVYFPNKPPKPPSNSSALPKLDFYLSLKALFKCPNTSFWLLNLSFAVSLGLYGVWSALLVVNFRNLLPQYEIGYLGCIASMSGFVSGILIGRLSSIFPRKYKLILMLTMCGSVLFTFWVVAIAERYVTLAHLKVQIYVAVILQSICMNGPNGVYKEAAVENNYPVSETVTSGALQMSYNIFPIMFLFVFVVPSIGTSWMNWLLYLALLLCFIFIASFKENYNRLSVDSKEITIQDRLSGNTITTVE